MHAYTNIHVCVLSHTCPVATELYSCGLWSYGLCTQVLQLPNYHAAKIQHVYRRHYKRFVRRQLPNYHAAKIQNVYRLHADKKRKADEQPQ